MNIQIRLVNEEKLILPDDIKMDFKEAMIFERKLQSAMFDLVKLQRQTKTNWFMVLMPMKGE